MWIARDCDNSLYLYEEKPMESEGCYYYMHDTQIMELDEDLFPELSYEDGPKQVELILME